MKVLQINSVYAYGSTGRIVRDIHNELKIQGFSGSVIYGRNKIKNNNDENIYYVNDLFSLTRHLVISRFLDLHGFGSNNSTIKIIHLIKNIRPDIIHLHNIHGYYLNVNILFKFLEESKIPVIWTLHDCWSYTGHCAYYDFIECSKWKTECSNCPLLEQYPKSYKDNTFNNYYEKKNVFTKIQNITLVTPSYWLKNELKSSYLSRLETVVIPNGIDTNRFTIKNSAFKEKFKDKFIILGVASVWDKRKGLSYFVELSNLLNDQELIIIVGKENHLAKNINNIICIDHTNSIDELVDIYNSANVFINPTLEDNFPTTNLEAQSCGIPVITFNTGGSPESINNKTGIICFEKTANSLYRAIKKVKETVYKREEIRANILNLFGKEKMYENYLNLYKNRAGKL